MTSPELLTWDDIAPPDISHLILEDDTPVDNFQSEKQQRLLVDPLYSSWLPGVPFVAAANVGIFHALNQDGIAPDTFLSLHVQMPEDWSQRQNRSYLVWEFGKVPEVCIEIVSNRKGYELIAPTNPKEKRKTSKKADYARLKVDYYAVFDPLRQIQEAEQMNGALLRIWALTTGSRYAEMAEPFYLEAVGLGLTLWEGEFEGNSGLWLRWCDRNGAVVPTGKERAEQERQRADQERQRANDAEVLLAQQRQENARLLERLQAMGLNPEEL